MARHPMLVLGVTFLLVGMTGASITSWFGNGQTVDGYVTSPMMPMMGGGMMHGPRTRGMMRDMLSGRLPAAVTPERLPDAESAGARLLARYCAQCHNLPTPVMHTAEEWPAVEARMFNRMAMMSEGRMGGMMRRHRMPVRAPTGEEQDVMLAYVQEHALRPADAESLGPPETAGLALFRDTCSQCHALPDPTLHTADEWPVVVERMRRNMKTMGRRVIAESERDQIVGYLSRAVGS